MLARRSSTRSVLINFSWVETVQDGLEVGHVGANVLQLLLSHILAHGQSVETFLLLGVLLIGKVSLVPFSLLRAQVLDHFNGEDDLREFRNLLPFLGACFFVVILKGTLLSIHSITFEGQISNLISNGHHFGLHVALEIGHLCLLLLQHEVKLLLLIVELILRAAQCHITVLNLHDLRILIAVFVLHSLEELFILLNCSLLLFYPVFLRLQNLELSLLTFDLAVALLVFFAELRNVQVAVTHYFCVIVEESCILDETLLQLVILFTKFGLSLRELELLLRELLLLRDECLLVLVHFTTLVEKSGRR